MVTRWTVVKLLLLGPLVGCQGTGMEMTDDQQAVAVGAAAGTGIALIAGGGFGEVAGAGLVGGAAGYLGGRVLRDGN